MVVSIDSKYDGGRGNGDIFMGHLTAREAGQNGRLDPDFCGSKSNFREIFLTSTPGRLFGAEVGSKARNETFEIGPFFLIGLG